jgi:hypothetical protein
MIDRDIVNDTVCWLLGCTWRYPSDHCCDRCGVDYCDESYHSAGLLHTARVMLSRGVAYLRYRFYEMTESDIDPTDGAARYLANCERLLYPAVGVRLAVAAQSNRILLLVSERCPEVWFPI